MNEEMTEIWKDIDGFDGMYQISNLGRVKSLTRDNGNHRNNVERVLKIVTDRDGYSTVCLAFNKVNKTKRIHRLVAIHFIENKNGYSQVNHINGTKSDNRAHNLEWCTPHQNRMHGIRLGLIKVSEKHKERCRELGRSAAKKVAQYTLDNRLIAEHPSATSAAKRLGVSNISISECCRGKNKTSYGFKWAYL